MQTKPPQVTVKKPPMYSLSISEPVTTDKTTYVSCQSVTEKPPIEFVESFIGFLNGKTTDNFYGNFWLGGFLVSLTAKPPILLDQKFGIGFFLGTIQTAVLRFQALQKHSFISM